MRSKVIKVPNTGFGSEQVSMAAYQILQSDIDGSIQGQLWADKGRNHGRIPDIR